jgi:hypothetical protein
MHAKSNYRFVPHVKNLCPKAQKNVPNAGHKSSENKIFREIK